MTFHSTPRTMFTALAARAVLGHLVWRCRLSRRATPKHWPILAKLIVKKVEIEALELARDRRPTGATASTMVNACGTMNIAVVIAPGITRVTAAPAVSLSIPSLTSLTGQPCRRRQAHVGSCRCNRPPCVGCRPTSRNLTLGGGAVQTAATQRRTWAHVPTLRCGGEARVERLSFPSLAPVAGPVGTAPESGRPCRVRPGCWSQTSVLPSGNRPYT